MALVFQAFYTDGISQLSYLVGDDSAGLAAVIDPRRDVGLYLDAAAAAGLRIAHAIETHIHADFASGTHELAARTGAGILGGEGEYGFPLRRLRDGEEIALGGVRLRALHTPGHTPEHICLTLSAEGQGEAPFGVFTGDTLFNLDVGRPDLLGDQQERHHAAALHESLFGRLLPLGDGVEVWPGHGAGSACGKQLGDRLRSSIGNERRVNPALRPREREEFVGWLLDGMPEPPRHYARLKRLNAQGAPVRGGEVPVPPPLPPAELERHMREGAVLVDTRSMLAFGGGHVAGALNIGLGEEFPTWLGWMVEHGTPILLVAEGPAQTREAAAHAFRLGYDELPGYLGGGMAAWVASGRPIAHLAPWSVQELEARRADPGLQILDVRRPDEFGAGRIPGARNLYVPHLAERLGELNRERPVATYCASGYRASIAASVLAAAGFRQVASIPGSWKAWRSAGLPVEG